LIQSATLYRSTSDLGDNKIVFEVFMNVVDEAGKVDATQSRHFIFEKNIHPTQDKDMIRLYSGFSNTSQTIDSPDANIYVK
jgi:hypothetical protein